MPVARKKSAPLMPKVTPPKPIAPVAAAAPLMAVASTPKPVLKPTPKPSATMTMPAAPKCPPCPPCPACASQTCVKACVNWYYFLFLLLALVGVGAILLQGVMLNKYIDLRFTAVERNIEAIQVSQTKADIKAETSATGPVSSSIYVDEESGLTFAVPTNLGPESYSVSHDANTVVVDVVRKASGTVSACETTFHSVSSPFRPILLENDNFMIEPDDLGENPFSHGVKVFSDESSMIYASDGETCGVTFARLK
ncbi:MAG: hypothetical protein V1745_04975 [Patescibacteria group bacterium]